MKKTTFILSLLFLGNTFAMTDYLPRFDAYDDNQKQSYSKRLTSLGNNYRPRTEHLNKDGSPIFINDLIFEESPYLLQHAHNPVNWQAWSPSAFAQAEKQNKPIFISIGYATCHWCHVMEHESFENIEIAQYINEHFVAIKIDRERRTAIDAYYMTGVQIMSGHGGWPMSNFTTPTGKPFFAGTYYRPNDFLTLLKRVKQVWHKQQAELIKQADNMDITINKHLSQSAQAQSIDQDVFSKVNTQLITMFDELQGGFSAAPKFPQEPWLLYLLLQNKTATNNILQFTLNQMQQGGVYDQIGGGFHRYATDNAWLTPHFEKMLYNQSQLSEVYTQAAKTFNNPEYKRTAIDILDYVLREMLSKQGVFYSAGDADSEGEEGLFFTWSYDELAKVLNPKEFEWLKYIYHFGKIGNFEHRNILNLSETLQASAKRLNMPYSEFIERLDAINLKLYTIRKERIHPLIDDKIITSWNAQMVYSLANTGYHYQKENYVNAAIKAMDYLYNNHRNNKNILVRNSLNGKASNINAELEDYAWMISALIKLYDVTDDGKWLTQAKELIVQSQQLFIDNKHGGFFDNIPEDNIPNSNRIKKSEDGAVVAANGQILIALARYYRRSGDLKVQELFEQTLAHFSGKIVQSPIAHTTMLRAKTIFDQGEQDNIIYTGNGNVKITSKVQGKTITLQFTIKKGWHINSAEQALEKLIPLSIKTQAKLTFKYPKAESTTLTFSTGKLSTFSGNFKVIADINKTTVLPIDLKIKLQACNDKVCLAPSEVLIIGFLQTK